MSTYYQENDDESESRTRDSRVQRRLPPPINSQKKLSLPIISPRKPPLPVISPRKPPLPITSQKNLPRPITSQKNLPQPVISPRNLPRPVISPRNLPKPVISPRNLPRPVTSQKNLPRRSQGKSATLDPISEIDTNIILMIDDIDTLISLYETQKTRFSRHLNKKYILDQLATKFGLEPKFKTFNEFVNAYNSQFRGNSQFSGAPPKFDAVPRKIQHTIQYRSAPMPGRTSYDNILLENERWNETHKRAWLQKLREVQGYPDIIKHTIRSSYPFLIEYMDPVTGIGWTSSLYDKIDNNVLTPSKELFLYINRIYKPKPEIKFRLHPVPL